MEIGGLFARGAQRGAPAAVQGGMLSRLAPFALLALAACQGQPEAGSVRFDPEPALAPVASEGAERIYRATGIEVPIDEGKRDLHMPIHFVPAEARYADPKVRAAANEGMMWTGFANDEEIVINEETAPDALPTVVLHEMLCHVVALKNGHPGDGGVCSDPSLPGERITLADLDWVCATAPCAWMQPEE